MNQPTFSSLRVLVVDDGAHRVRLIAETLIQQGHEVVAVLDEATRIFEAVQRQRPDIVIVDAEAPGRDTLEHLATLHDSLPRPVLMFSEDARAVTVRDALKAGVSAYVVAGLRPERLEAVMAVACARFDQDRALREELQSAQLQLAARKQIERAKGLLMQEQGLSEEQAYARLRRLAMDRCETLAQVAERVVEAAKLLRS
ncbi:ANTAR domain-containing protein [Inhella sp. 4Y17]|uniref:ANTAR domain-containing protein n=1 Tax=Inhella gelatinilytica TaxID=2795030 RepID=A0A931IT51_9BURK|nr:ANTAR domain-containing protein [Inhella gelatinilytica]